MLIIDRYWKNALLMLALLAMWLVVTTGVIWALAHDTLRNPVPLEWLKLGVCSAVMLGTLLFLFYYFTCRVVFRAELGEDIHLRMLLGERHIHWQQVGRLNIKRLASPIPAANAVHWILIDGRRYVLWANIRQGDDIHALASSQPLPRDWPGLPMDGAVMSVVLLLGIVVLGCGAVLDVALINALLHPQPNNAILGLKTFGAAVAASILVPLLGLASIGFATFHLWRRPIMVRPGLVRTSEAQPQSPWESLRGLFGSPE